MFGTSLREARSIERLVSTPLTTFEALVGESPLSFGGNEGGSGGHEALAGTACDLAEALAEGIMTAHPQMPVFTFTPEQIDDLLAYLDSLK